ncbi:hypothetical protein NKR23_g8467 [Pleurostoma richardsiae]|uniref:Steroid 5-alpha reductase C-terminal domain-containing protein n=1 Tax=Pleurostoma richardsiae TaxID=41990 RepID=A0AA38RT44_9PEZI|nr:hypothetical protein NKR23_g8467 [Pleurostoma richardsiae]
MASKDSPPATQPGKHPGDLINRGVKRQSPSGTATFIGLRSLDPLLQYQLLFRGLGPALLARLGVSAVPASSSALAGLPTALGLPLPHLLLLGMAAGSSAKQIFWLLDIAQEYFPPSSAAAVSTYNTLVNSVNSLLLLAGATSAALSTPALSVPLAGGSGGGDGRWLLPLPVVVGALMYAVGITIETVSEIQRKRFKEQPGNEGKVCTEGLWRFARRVNYTGYTLWRTGFTLAAGGWIPGLITALFNVWNFMKSTAMLDDYMARKYGNEWDRVRKEVRWAVVPGIY